MLPMMEVRSTLTGTRGVGLPFSDVVPILGHTSRASLDELSDVIIAEGKRRSWKYAELRAGLAVPAFAHTAEFVEHVLPLDRSIDALKAGLRSSTRRNIGRASRDAVTTTISASESAVETYYGLHCETRRRHGLPPQPIRFFRSLHTCLIRENGGIVILGFHGTTAVAGAVFLNFGRSAVYKYGASLPEHHSVHANSLVMWEAITWYHARGYSTLSFGRTGLDETGLLHYKDGWAGEREPVQYSRWPARAAKSTSPLKLAPAIKRIASRLPMGLLKVAGDLLYQHMG